MNLRAPGTYKRIAAWVTLLMTCCLTSLAQQQDTSVHEILVDTQAVLVKDTVEINYDNIDTVGADENDAQTTSDTERIVSDQTDTIPYYYPDSIVNRSVSEHLADSFRNSRLYAYANDPRYWTNQPVVEKEKRQGPGALEKILGSLTFRIILYTLLALLLVYVVYRIIVNNSLFYGPSRKLVTEEAVREEEIRDVDLDAKITQSIASGDHRAAVRFMYLKGLQRLDLAGLISYHPQATNYEYTRQLKTHALAGDFEWLTHVYEYIWYGEFRVNEEQFGLLRAYFEKFYKSVRS